MEYNTPSPTRCCSDGPLRRVTGEGGRAVPAGQRPEQRAQLDAHLRQVPQRRGAPGRAGQDAPPDSGG